MYNKSSTVDFQMFLEQVAHAIYRDYIILPSSKVKDEHEFEIMRKHILSLYANRQIVSSFKETNGLYWDCVLTTQDHANPPPPNAPLQAGAGQPPDNGLLSKVNVQSNVQERAVFPKEVVMRGTVRSVCQQGTYPMMRVTLERVVQFRTLTEFMSLGKKGKPFG